MKSHFLLLVAALALGLVALPARSAPIKCPAVIFETPGVASVDKQWTVVASAGERQLERAGIYVGTPAEYSAQAPDSTEVRKRVETVTWKMPASETETFWAGCSYAGTTAVLFKKLDPGVTVCVASYLSAPVGKRQRLKGMDCR